MWLFLFLIIPMTIVFQFLSSGISGYKIKSEGKLVVLSGMICGLIYLFVKAIFFTSNWHVSASFGQSFLHLFVFESIIPFFSCAAVFFIISKNRDAFYFENLHEFYDGFLIIFLPFQVLSSNFSACGFMLFVFPLLCAVMCIFLKLVMYYGISVHESHMNFAFYFLAVFILFLVLAVPAAIKTLWLIDGSNLWICICSLLYCVGCGVFAFFTKSR